MPTKTREAELTELEAKARLVITTRTVSTKSLGEALGVSTVTAARAVAGLRKKGINVVSVREGERWRYEIRDWKEEERARWERSRLRKMAGFAKGTPEKLKPEDQAIYGRD